MPASCLADRQRLLQAESAMMREAKATPETAVDVAPQPRLLPDARRPWPFRRKRRRHSLSAKIAD
jgi:hypothetical protein